MMFPSTTPQPLPDSLLPSLTPTFQPFEMDIVNDGNNDNDVARKRLVHARELYGFEGFVALMSETGTGFSHLTNSFSVNFNSTLTYQRVLSASQRAWIRLRHLVPGIACRTFGIPKDQDFEQDETHQDSSTISNKAHYLLYEVPQDQEEVSTWAEQTVSRQSFDDDEGKDGLTLKEFNEELSKEFWKPGEGRWNMQLKFEKSRDGENQWLFALNACHHSVDGRGGFMILDEFLYFLIDDLRATDSSFHAQQSLVAWGEETVRLPPCMSLFLESTLDKKEDATEKKSLYETVTENEIAEETGKEESEGEEVQPGGPSVPFFRPYPTVKSASNSTTSTPPQASATPNVSHTLTLSRPMTRAFQRACKAHGNKITAVVDSMLILAEIEAVLKKGAETIGDPDGQKKWEEVEAMFDKAGCVIVPLKFIDMRSSLPGTRSSFSSPTSTPLFALTRTPHIHGMQSFRDVLSVQNEDESGSPRIVRNSLEERFWNGPVRDSAELWKDAKPTSEAFVTSEHEMASTLSEIFNPTVFNIPGIISSSMGDFDRMGAPSTSSSSFQSQSTVKNWGLLGRWNETVIGPMDSENSHRSPQSLSSGPFSEKSFPSPQTPPIDARIEEIKVIVRSHCYPFLVSETYLFDGKFNFSCFGSRGFYTDEDMELWTKGIEGWVLEAIGGKGSEEWKRVKKEEVEEIGQKVMGEKVSSKEQRGDMDRKEKSLKEGCAGGAISWIRSHAPSLAGSGTLSDDSTQISGRFSDYGIFSRVGSFFKSHLGLRLKKGCQIRWRNSGREGGRKTKDRK